MTQLLKQIIIFGKMVIFIGAAQVDVQWGVKKGTELANVFLKNSSISCLVKNSILFSIID